MVSHTHSQLSRVMVSKCAACLPILMDTLHSATISILRAMWLLLLAGVLSTQHVLYNVHSSMPCETKRKNHDKLTVQVQHCVCRAYRPRVVKAIPFSIIIYININLGYYPGIGIVDHSILFHECSEAVQTRPITVH